MARRAAGTILFTMDQVHLTPSAQTRLREELAERTGPGGSRSRAESSQGPGARGHPENADYDAAKNEQGQNEARVRHIEAILRSAVIVEGSGGEVVGPGTVVEIRMDQDDETTQYLVGSIEERPEELDVLSVSSPLGQALLGAGPGQVVEYTGPRRTFHVEVVSVRPA